MPGFQIPGTMVKDDKTTFGGPYPVNDHGTGFNNIEWNDYPAPVNNRIWPVAHPLDPSRPTCLHYELHSGDKQPNYGSAGYRSEGWGEPHTGEDGQTQAYAYSVVIDKRTTIPANWCDILQDHAGENSGPWIYPTWTLALHDGTIRVQVQAEFDQVIWEAIQYERELFCLVEIIRRGDQSGRTRTWLSWDHPLAIDAPPTYERHGKTQYGVHQYWKQGIYAGPAGDPANIYLDVTTCALRDSIEAARTVAGGPWVGGGGVPPIPPVTPAPFVLLQSIKAGDTLAGTATWVAVASDDSRVDHVDFLIDGVIRNTEHSAPWGSGDPPNTDGGQFDTKKYADGIHTFIARATFKDGSTSSVSASATIKNATVPVPPTNAELRDQAVAALKATTSTYAMWKVKADAGSYPDITKTKWWQAFDLLSKIK